MNSKNWWESRIVQMMILQFMLSLLALAQEFVAKGDFSIVAILGMVSAIIVTILRIFYTDTQINNIFTVDAKKINAELEKAEESDK